MINWLPEPSVAALRAALMRSCPQLADMPIQLASVVQYADPSWFRGSAQIGDKWIVKFAWSEPAAEKLRQEIENLQAMAAFDKRLPLPRVVVVSADPQLLIYERVPGSPITYEGLAHFDPTKKRRLASSLANVLALLHSPATRQTMMDSGVNLPSPTPQADTFAIRARLCPTLQSHDAIQVIKWCDWVDQVQEETTPDVVLHGDFHGYNVIIDETAEVRVILDLEEMSLGDLHYDFRYLPAQESSVEFFTLVATAYAALTGKQIEIERVMAWHIRTVLGDALWRGEAKVPLPGGGTVQLWIEQLAARMAELRSRICGFTCEAP